jgi:nucleoside-diphosphate-sugar epimerase
VHDLVDRGATYLVTGGAGFIGSHLVQGLVEAGAQVRVLDDFSTGRRENLAPFVGGHTLLEGSITDPSLCVRACEGVDYVLHQAALPSVERSVRDPLTTHEVDVTGTLNLLIAARDAGARRFVFAGSSSAYGGSTEIPQRESQSPRARSPYAAAKLASEHYCQVFAEVFGLETVVLRYFNVFGPRQDPTSQYSAVIPIFITRALEGAPPVINGDGEQTRDFTYVKNVVQANLQACRAPAERVSGEVFNVGCGTQTSVNDLWEAIRRLLGAEVAAEHGPPRAGDVERSLASLDKARARLGYDPRVDFETGLGRTIEWFQAPAAIQR